MIKTLLIKIFYVTLLVFCTTGCNAASKVVVKQHSHFMGPTTWEAVKDDISVPYYRGDCFEAEKVLTKLADDANKGLFDWNNMLDITFRDNKLKTECINIRSK